MNPSPRKKKPPDLIILLSVACSGGRFQACLPLSLPYSEYSSPSVFFPGLELYHCSGHPRYSGSFCLLSPSDLTLHGLHGNRSSASANSSYWTRYLSAQASSESAIGESQQYHWVWLWVYRPKQGQFGSDLLCASGATLRLLRRTRLATLFGKVCIALSSPFVRQRYVLSPLNFLIVPMDYTRPFSSHVVQTKISVSCICRFGPLRCRSLWSSLGLTRQIGVVIPVTFESLVFRLQSRFSNLWRHLLGQLEFLDYGFASTHDGSVGSARLIVQDELLAGCSLIRFTIWIHILCCRMVYASMLGVIKLAEIHTWYFAILFQIIWRLLIVLVFLELLHPSFLLLEGTYLWLQRTSYFDTPSHGVRIHNSMMSFCARLTAGWLDLSLSLGSFSFWLAMLMVRLMLSIYMKKMSFISSEDSFATSVWVICCLDLHLLDGRLKSTMIQLGVRFKPTMVALPFCWMLVNLGIFQTKLCWILGHLCDEQSVATRKDSLFHFSSCMPLGMCVDGFADILVQFGHCYGGSRPLTVLCERSCLLFEFNQHVFLYRLPVGLVDETPHRGWFLNYVLIFLSSFTASWYVVVVFWGLPLIWLSLPLQRQFAPKQEPLWSSFCWQLLLCQHGRDEVKGKALVVNEDMLSETSVATYFVMSRGVCRVAWCFGAGTWHSFSWTLRRTERRQDGCSSISSALDNILVAFWSFTSSLCYSVGMYCSCNVLFSFSVCLESPVMFVIGRLQCNNDTVVSSIFGCCIPSFIICNVSFFRDLEQHLCVRGMCLMALGPCLMALEQHRRMLGIAC